MLTIPPLVLELDLDAMDMIIDGLGELPARRSAATYLNLQAVRARHLEQAAKAKDAPAADQQPAEGSQAK